MVAGFGQTCSTLLRNRPQYALQTPTVVSLDRRSSYDCIARKAFWTKLREWRQRSSASSVFYYYGNPCASGRCGRVRDVRHPYGGFLGQDLLHKKKANGEHM